MDGTFGFSPELCLVTIVILVVLYLLSKLWQAQLEPNIRVIGKSEKVLHYILKNACKLLFISYFVTHDKRTPNQLFIF